MKAALVRETDHGLKCSWHYLSVRLYELGLDDDERAFLDLLLAMVYTHQTSLFRVIGMNEHRLTIILRTIIRLFGNNALAVGTRV